MTGRIFRKKPVVIEAIQWSGTPESSESVRKFCPVGFAIMEGEPKLLIETVGGIIQISVGDWIIRGIAGEFDTCKPELFSQTYEEVKT